jgi:3-hydroxyisobutyrate dehydrogenase
MRVAVLGTGIMGAPIARNLVKAGHDVAVWNRTREKAEQVEGAQVAGEPREAVRGADVVVTMLAAVDAVRDVMTGATLDAFGDHTPWLQMSTVGVAATEELAERAASAGVLYVDCPVLGTKEPAEGAKLTVVASGPETTRERADKVFDAISQSALWLGDEAGEGTRMKLVINSWVLGLTEVLAESMALAQALGVDREKVLEILDGNPVGSPYAQLKGKMIISESFDPSFPLRLAAKDARLVLEAAGEQVELPATRATAEQMQRATELGYGDSDMAATYYACSGGAAA